MAETGSVTVSIAISMALSAPIAHISIKKGYLTKDGVLASLLVAVAAAFTGLRSFIYIFAFFISSSMLTYIGYKTKQTRGSAEKSGGRTWRQVFGAGGVGSLLFVLSFIAHYLGFYEWAKYSLLTALVVFAASTADTWAAEIGSLSKKEPRLVVKPWVKVCPGTSGGVTMLGELASISGAAFMGFVAVILTSLVNFIHYGTWSALTLSPHITFAFITSLGWLGEFLDSIVGATLQAKYYCPECGTLTDKEVHICGSLTQFHSGFKFIGNESTNVIATSILALVSLALAYSLNL